MIESREQYESMLEALVQQEVDVGEAADPSDAFLRKMDPVKYYKRGVDQVREKFSRSF